MLAHPLHLKFRNNTLMKLGDIKRVTNHQLNYYMSPSCRLQEKIMVDLFIPE